MSYFESGRINQKLRTRDLLVSTAKDLLRQGKLSSVAEVARIARVSRATAYMYFPTQAQLISQAILKSVSEIDYDHQFDELFKAHAEPDIRVAAVVGVSDASIRSHEGEYREMLRMSLEKSSNGVPHRSNFRVRWLERALESLRGDLPKRKFQHLIASLGLCVGIEPAVVLHDVFGLSADEAREVKLWAAGALLESAIREMKPGRRAAAGRKAAGKKARSQEQAKRRSK